VNYHNYTLKSLTLEATVLSQAQLSCIIDKHHATLRYSLKRFSRLQIKQLTWRHWEHLRTTASLKRHTLTLWRPLLPYGHSYKACCARPG